MRSTAERIALWSTAAGVAAGLGLFAARFLLAISFVEPLQLTTSGAEEESLYAIWKVVHGLPIYADPHRIPFAASYYNWLYFETYGELTKLVIYALALGDAWIPTVVRLITTGICIVGAWLLYRTLVLVAEPPAGLPRWLAAAFAVNFFFGPLAGFWSFTAHVEVIASFFLVISLLVFCRLYRSRPIAAVLAFCMLAYATWGMKQNYVFAAGAVGLFLLWRREWKLLAILATVLPAAWAATVLLSSADYRKLAFFTDTDLTITVFHLLAVLRNVATKSLPLLLGAGAVALIIWRDCEARREIGANPMFRLFLTGLAIALPIVVPTSGFVGAAENYYFPVVYFLTVTIVIAISRFWPNRAHAGRIAAAVAVGWVLDIAAIATVFAGYSGTISLRNYHDRYLAIEACIKGLPAPAFVPNVYNMLPWMYPAGPHFVMNYNYYRDRAEGRAFERGGIGGLIGDGFFGAVLLAPRIESFDGAALSARYVHRGECAGYAVWIRADLAPRR